MKHTITSAADRPGMTLDQLQAAVERARRSGATGEELVTARLFGRAGGLRSIAIDLEEPLPVRADVNAAPDRSATKASDRRK